MHVSCDCAFSLFNAPCESQREQKPTSLPEEEGIILEGLLIRFTAALWP